MIINNWTRFLHRLQRKKSNKHPTQMKQQTPHTHIHTNTLTQQHTTHTNTRLFQMYSKIVKDLQNNRKSALGNKKKNYQEEDTYKDILLLLKISRVISNYAQESEQGASLMLFGLNIILPLLNSELIRVRKE